MSLHVLANRLTSTSSAHIFLYCPTSGTQTAQRAFRVSDASSVRYYRRRTPDIGKNFSIDIRCLRRDQLSAIATPSSARNQRFCEKMYLFKHMIVAFATGLELVITVLSALFHHVPTGTSESVTHLHVATNIALFTRQQKLPPTAKRNLQKKSNGEPAYSRSCPPFQSIN